MMNLIITMMMCILTGTIAINKSDPDGTDKEE